MTDAKSKQSRQEDRSEGLVERVTAFMSQHIYQNEERFFREVSELGPWRVFPIVEELKAIAKAEGLWNLFLPESEYGAGLTNLEYTPICEIMGRSPHLAPEVFNCSAPDTGNMELLVRYGTKEQKRDWLEPLLSGEIRSAFAMTEPAVASSDATNITCSIKREGNSYLINGRKWFTSGATDPRCKILIVMGKSNASDPDRHRQQSMILVPKATPGVEVVRPLPMFGFYGLDRTSEVTFTDVRVPASNLILGEGRGFEIAQGRLGPGRIHHCMRLIGLCERVLERMCRRAGERTAFGSQLASMSVTMEHIAESRIMIEQIRLLTQRAAQVMDENGNKAARREIAMIKVAVPNAACQIIDWAIQVFGGAGVTNDFGLASAYALARALRIADGPDEVHRNQISRLELARYRNDGIEKDGNSASPRYDIPTVSFPR